MSVVYLWFLLFCQLLGSVSAIIVFCRAVCVVAHLDFRRRTQHYVRWALFGTGYILLALCALGSLPNIWRDCLDFRDILWNVASAMLIIFDRRRRIRWAGESSK
jgi:hypothetical protein